MFKQTLLTTLFVCCLLATWEYASRTLPSLRFVLPAPSAAVTEILARPDRFALHAWATLREIAGGLGLSIAFAFPAAWMMTLWRPVRSVLQPLLVVTQSLPIFAIAPLMILWFDWSYTAIVVPTALMIFFPLTINIYQGLSSTPQEMLDYFKLYKATSLQTFMKLRLPWAWPHICSGVRISAAIAGIGAVAGEWAGAQEGLGVLMLESRRAADLPTMFGALLCLMTMSLGIYGLTVALERLSQRPRAVTSLGAVCITMSLILSGCSSSSQPTQPRLVLDWLPNPNHIPLFVGVEKGFFRENGIDLQILKLYDPGDAIVLLTSGQTDFAVGYMPHIINAIEKGAVIYPVGYLVKQPLNSFIFRSDADIKTPYDLNGKVIGLTTDDVQIKGLKYTLEAHSITPKAMRFVGFDLVTALATGKVDAIYGAYWNIECENLAALGIGCSYIPVQDVGVPHYFELVIMSSRNAPEIAKAFKVALQECIAFCQQHPDDAFAIYLKSNPDKSAFTQSWERRAWQRTLPLFAPNQDDEPDVWGAALLISDNRKDAKSG